MAGLTDSGFEIKRLPEILTDLRTRANPVFNDILPVGDVVDTSDSAALGRLISLIGPSLADLWEASQEVYSAFDANAATGTALDNLVAYAAITRKEQTASIVSLILTGAAGTTIPAGSSVKSVTSDVTYNTLSDLTLLPVSAVGIGVEVVTVVNDADYKITYSSGSYSITLTYHSELVSSAPEILYGLKSIIDSAHPALDAAIIGNILYVNKVEVFESSSFLVSNLSITKVSKIVQARATTVGPNKQDPNTVTQILTPTLGWEAATNPPAAIPGTLESDEDLRIRFRNSKAIRATNIIESLYSALYNVSEVTSVRVYENYTDVMDSFGTPPHSFKVVILGGDSVEIANAIWINKPLGITTSGNTEVTIIDSELQPHSIFFVRPSPVPVYIDIVLKVDSTFPSNGAELIKLALVNYFADNIGVGEAVIYSRLYTPINTVEGHEIISLNIGTVPGQTASNNITFDFDQIASLATTNINIVTTSV